MSFDISILVHKFQLVRRERKDSADVIRNAEWEQSNDEEQQEHSPEAKIFHKLLPCSAEAGQHAIAVMQVWVEKRVALHGTAGDNE